MRPGVRTLWPALLLLLTAAAPAPPAAQALADEGDAQWVAFDLTPGNQIRFEMQVAGHTVTALLDTGVSHSAMSRRTAALLGLAVREGGSATTIGGQVPIGWAQVPAVSLGSMKQAQERFAVVDLPDAASGHAPVDVLAGRDLLQGYALDIDFATRRFRLLPSGRLPFAGVTAPLAIGGSAPTYLGELAIDGRSIGRVSIDTGDGGTVTLTDAAWRQVAGAAPTTTTTLAYGIGGPEVTGLSIMPAVSTGAASTADVPVAVEGQGGFSQSIGVSGRIGAGFLQRFRVLLDPGAGRMVLAPAANLIAAPRSTSGLLVTRDGERLRVIHVMRAGPAEATGWRTGDEICAVDGSPAAPTDWLVGAPGRVVSLALCNGATRQLTLRRFY